MLILIAMMSLSQAQPGPLDAFRANLAASRVNVEFECMFHDRVPYSSLITLLEKRNSRGLIADEPSYVARGRWGFDGSCEHYTLRFVGGAKFDPQRRVRPLPPFELIWDGSLYAYHYLIPGEDVLHVEMKASDPPLYLVGPFAWKRRYRFDREIDVAYAAATVERKRELREGQLFEWEIYKKSSRGSTVCFEVCYDPNSGYIPNRVRIVAYGLDKISKIASVLEFYITETLISRTGGFIPAEWYLASFHVQNFELKYPNYTERTRLTASDDPRVAHFKLLSMEDQKEPVKLSELEGVTRAWALGGSVEGKEELPTMNMTQLKKKMGRKLVPSNAPIIANVDSADIHEFDKPNLGMPWIFYTGAIVALFVVSGLLRAWRRGRSLLILFFWTFFVGCGARPIPLATVTFAPDVLLYDASRPSIQARMVVNNAGNRPLRIFDVDAGCSCRPVDQSKLPALVRPGESLSLTMSFSGGQSYNPQPFVISLATDHGKLTAQATLLALPNHYVTPQSVAMPALIDGSATQDESFELLHRQIYDTAAGRAAVNLTPPRGFTIETIASRSGRVSGSPSYTYEDTTYRFTLKDRTVGLHRANILLQSAEGQIIIGTPIVWERSPFLCSAPSRVALSSRPVRAFLRCPDDAVELVRVLSAPKGVKAVVGSPREVVISTLETAPGIINGFVEVETTAKGHGPLRIPVVRYAPLPETR